MPDAHCEDPRLAVLYDVFDDDRSDLDLYVGIAQDLGARRVIDLGCGTGTLALRLGGLDPRADRPAPRRAFGTVETWVEVSEVALPLVTFRGTYEFPDGTVLTSDSTLQFRTLRELIAGAETVGFEVAEVRDAPDRPELEYVVILLRGEGSAAGQARARVPSRVRR